jgi:hypothetical protein
MAPDSSTRIEITPAAQPATDLFGPIAAEINRLEEHGKLLRAEAVQKLQEADGTDRQILAIRAQPATLAGTQAATVTGLVVGQFYEGRGVYMGQMQPKNRNGRRIGKTYNLFAAKNDIKSQSGGYLMQNFKNMVREVAAVRGLHDHDGASVADVTALIRGLKDGSLEGKWVIPPLEWLLGKNVNHGASQTPSLYALRNTRAFADTFVTKPSVHPFRSPLYWCLADHRDGQSILLGARFSDGNYISFGREFLRMSCRPCRVELVI